ncbi:hypothetical protein LSH36_172g04007 [Paralvinella palmiformis]|uniref:J domain-containing protein n=1 Tax=Paralvinella palmiformis TaxID=53620 RepID=A0AAD9N6A1_9ANNE|nr:hypothetical protein LSH36_172g04007 [Paralvinella palmiformis]
MTVNEEGVICLPPAEEGDTTQIFGKIPELVTVRYEPVGRWYEALCRRRLESNTLSHQSTESLEDEEEEVEVGEEDADEELLLRSLDPKEWKQQDHYAVIGLRKLRQKATYDEIKRAYKKKVLLHHPDKRRARGIPVKEGEEDYFTCITRAYEILGVPSKRRSYDSIDPEFDDSIPSVNAESKEHFYESFRPVFERNARWSTKKKVPELGDENTPFSDVDKFYSFWYDFDSWREYSYLDEEDKEKGENREERRWIEKQNKAARQKRKKEETARIRQLVDNSYACDPRIVRHKEEEKQRKLAEKQAKKDAVRAKVEEEKRISHKQSWNCINAWSAHQQLHLIFIRKLKMILKPVRVFNISFEQIREAALEEERKVKEKEEEEARIQAAAVKKEKEALKKALKKERKTFRNTVKEYDYFASDDTQKIEYMQEVDKLAELLSLTSLQDLNSSLTSGDREKAKDAFFKQVSDMHVKEEEEKRKQLELLRSQSSGGGQSSGAKVIWGEDEIQMLIKAVNLFPAGTAQRWETVANFIKQHVPSSKKSPKEVLAKAKELQRLG